MKRIFVVHNPVVGTTDRDTFISTLDQFCTEHDISCERHETQEDDDIPAIVREAVQKGFDIVVAAGGDGTVSAVANGLINSKTSLGILPLGSGNALARETDIPLQLDQALILLTGPSQLNDMDTLLINGTHYLLNLSVGMSSSAILSTPRAQKRRFGKAAYMLQGLTHLTGIALKKYILFVDERRVVTRASEIIVANAGLVGFKQLRLDTNIRPDDGVLQVCILRASTLGDYMNLFWKILLRKRGDNAGVVCLPAKQSIRIETKKPQPVQADGEMIGETPVDIGVEPKSIRLIVPIPPESETSSSSDAP